MLNRDRRRLLLLTIVRIATVLMLCAIGVRSGWQQLGLFAAAFVANAVSNIVALRIYNPELFWERMKPNHASEHFDRVALAGIGFSSVLLFVVAGLDVLSFQWSVLSWQTSIQAVAVWVIGMVPITWAMAINPFLTRTVQHQTSRGHEVISEGPYRFVRHPMYTGMCMMSLSLGPMLGSAIAVVPAILFITAIIYRTVHEDALLQRRLDGYAEFAERTRFRLVPGIW